MRQEIENLYRDASLMSIALIICKNEVLAQDLLQECFLSMLEMSEEKFKTIKNKKGFFIKTMINQFNGHRTAFSKQKNRDLSFVDNYDYTEDSDDVVTLDINEKEIKNCLKYFDTITDYSVRVANALEKIKNDDNENGRFHYRTEIMKAYFKTGSYRKLSKEIGISHQSVYYVVKKLKEII